MSLSADDRRTLAEIERELRVDDPALARSLRSLRSARLARHRSLLLVVAVLGFLATIAGLGVHVLVSFTAFVITLSAMIVLFQANTARDLFTHFRHFLGLAPDTLDR